jgi:hypothetical protein
VKQKQAPLEGRLGAARAGIRKVHDPELTLNKVQLGMMLGTRVARGHWLDGDYGENERNRGTDASGQVAHSSSSVRIDVPAQASIRPVWAATRHRRFSS